jgi:hypothetical protein
LISVQAVGTVGHAAQAVYEDCAVRGERLNQVGEILALDYAGVFHAADGIVAERQGAVLDAGEPSLEAAEGKRILLAGVDDGHGQRRAELSTSALGENWQRRRRDWSGPWRPCEWRRN